MYYYNLILFYSHDIINFHCRYIIPTLWNGYRNVGKFLGITPHVSVAVQTINFRLNLVDRYSYFETLPL